MRRSLSGGARGRALADQNLTPARLEGGDGINCGGNRRYRASASRARLALGANRSLEKVGSARGDRAVVCCLPCRGGPGEADEAARIHDPYAESAAE
jgi:hypothetical protein